MPGKHGFRWGQLLGLCLLLGIFLAGCGPPRSQELFLERVDEVLKESWAFYQRHFIGPDGRVQRPDTGDDTVSEGQAYGLLRAVWSDDQAAFDRLYGWAEANLSQQRLKGTHLLSWHWGRDEQGRWGLLDANSATDGDLDYALALVLAHRTWGKPREPLPDYLAKARLVLRDILDRETCRDPWGRLWLAPGDWAACRMPLVINPSYFSPAWYEIFYHLTQDRRWLELKETAFLGLEILNRGLGKQPGCGLAPDWCQLENKEIFTPAPGRSSAFGWDAGRVPWRVGLAGLWFDEPRSKKYLQETFLPFCQAQLGQHGKIFAIYDYAGRALVTYESPLLYASLIAAALATGDQPLARQAAEKILNLYHQTPDGGYFNRPDDYYGNNWAWLGLATYRGLVTPEKRARPGWGPGRDR